MELATQKQKEFIKQLCQKLDYDQDDYNFATMTKAQASETISEMLKEV